MCRNNTTCHYVPEIFKPIKLYKNEKGEKYLIIPIELGKFTLKEYLQSSEKKISIEEHYTIILTLFLSLISMHSQKFAHRDFKLDNVLFFESNIPLKLSDFGISLKYENVEGKKPLNLNF